MVLLKGINDTEVDSMVEFARSEGVSLQIIELIKTDSDTFYDQYHMFLRTKLNDNSNNKQLQLISRDARSKTILFTRRNNGRIGKAG